MSNTSRPADLRCTDDHGCVDCYPREPAPPGVCVHCDLGTCSGCGAPMTPEQCATSRTECPVPARDGVYCPACLGEVCDGPAVPVAVDDEASCAQTVRLETDPSVKATGVEWSEQLSKEVA